MSYNPITDLPKSQMYRDMMRLGIYDLDGTTLVRSEMRAYQYGFQVMQELIDEIMFDWWPESCSQERLKEWEGILGIPPRAGASLAQRREAVLRFLALGAGERTPAGAEELLKAVGLLGEIEEDFAGRKITVQVTGLADGYETMTGCEERLRGLLPAHMALEVVDAR